MNKAGSECWLRKLQSSWLLNKSRHGTLCHSTFTEFNLEQMIYLLWTGGLYKEFLGQDLQWALSCSEQKSNRSRTGLSWFPWAAPPRQARGSCNETQGQPMLAVEGSQGSLQVRKARVCRSCLGLYITQVFARSWDHVGVFVPLALP